ncbi:MAG: metal-dependent hydrolase [Flavobacteriaceae bacterium]
MKITFLGHASLLIETKNATLLVDPFITGNPKCDVDINSLDPDYILVTHAHQDHTLDVELVAKQSGATIVSNYEIATHYQRMELKTHPLNHGGSWKFPFGILKYVNAIHTSSFPDGTYGGQPGGFIVLADDRQIYIAGDTALTMDMKLIGQQHQLHLAVLPIGDNFTMGYEDAVLASDFVGCDKVLGYHYDTFGYIEIDHNAAISTFRNHGKTLHLLDIGASMVI